MSKSAFQGKGALVTSGAVISSLVASGCAGAPGPSSVVPPSRSQAASEIVAAYGSSEKELARVISDAKALNKVARFVTVMNGAVQHVFPPTATLVRTDHVLIAHAYGHAYVWPLNGVSLSYSGSGSMALASLPKVSAPHTDKTVMAIAAFASHTARLNNARTECNDCYVFAATSQATPGTSPASKVVQDPWQVGPDYATWTDPNVPAPSTAIEQNKAGKRAVRGFVCISEGGFTESSGGGWCDGSIYYLSPGYPPTYYGGGGGPVTPPSSIYISVGISSAGSPISNGNVIVPTAGHLYVNEWQGAWPNITPTGEILQAGAVGGKLQFASFSQNPNADFQSFLLQNGQQTTPQYQTYWQDLVNARNRYQSRLNIAPAYNPGGMNSNSWAYGLMLYAGDFSASEIQRNIGLDQTMSALIPYFWENGVQLQANFQ